jgi:Eukaryotic cytochrome b561
MKSSIEKESSRDKTALERVEVVVNVANHCLLSIVCFYLIWYCFQDNWSELTCYHSLLCTLGFFCMTEGILMMYSNNALSKGESKTARTNFHWVLQALGAVFMISGAIIEYIFREMQGKIHFHATHALIGK